MSPIYSPGIIESVDIDKIKPSAYCKRKDLGALKELSASIIEQGLLQPIVVRPKKGAYEVIAGNRRLEACRRIGRRKIECNIIIANNRQAQEIAIVENVQRHSLNPFEEALTYKAYIEKYGYGSVSSLAAKIGKTPSYISRKISLLHLEPKMQEELLRRRKSTGIAEELAVLSEEKRREIWPIVMKAEIKRADVRGIIKHINNNDELASLDYNGEKISKRINISFTRAIISLRICLNRIDEIIDNLDEKDWLLRETMMEERQFIHGRIDRLLLLKKKVMKLAPFSLQISVLT